MTKTVESFNVKKLWLTLVFASILLIPLGISTNQAFAMGQAPSTCPNRYDGPITLAKITADGKIYDPIANPGLTFKLANDQFYTLTFTIHTPAQSSQGNSDPGTTWYRDTIHGFGNGHCVSGAGPNQDVIITGLIGHSNSIAPVGIQRVEFSTLVSSGFYYHVRWINPGDNSTTTPDPPTNLSANAVSPSQIDLSWAAPDYDGGSPITEYIIWRFHDCNSTSLCYYTVHTNSTATTYSDTGLGTNISYYYRVYAVNQVGTSYPSNIASATTFGTVPSQPLGLTANAVSSSQIDLSWNAPSYEGGAQIIGYKIERSEDNGSSWSDIVSNTASTSTRYSDTNLLPSTIYTYRVSAINSLGSSQPSNIASATTMSANSRAFVNDQFDSDLSGWQYYGEPGYSVSLDTTTGVPSPASRIAGDAWLSYCSKHGMYKVADISSYSDGPLTLGLNWRAASATTDSITTNALVDIIDADTGTILFTQQLAGGGTTDTGWQYYSTDISSYVSDVNKVQISLYLVDCWNANWNEYNWYDNISVVGKYSPPSVPGAPTGLSATAVSSSQIELSWIALDDGGSLITGYRIDRSEDNGSTWSTIVSNIDSTNTAYSDTGLDHSTTYTYRVFAVNEIGSSPPSDIASATTFDVVPQPPTDLTANAVSSSQIDLSWTAPSDDGGSSVIGYMIERSDDNSSSWSTVVDNTGSTDTTYSDTGLSPNTTYTYRVSAINSVGASDPSDIASVTTPLLSAAGITVGPISVPTPQPTPVNLSVQSADMSGTTFEGMWVELWKDGMIIQSGWTPFSTYVQTGSQYEVFIQNWEDIVFDHWEDGSTDQRRAITPTQDTALTAFFRTS